eukprot:Platyproteum_vivax@DN12611_c0_g1_i1.p2
MRILILLILIGGTWASSVRQLAARYQNENEFDSVAMKAPKLTTQRPRARTPVSVRQQESSQPQPRLRSSSLGRRKDETLPLSLPKQRDTESPMPIAKPRLS